MGEKTRDDEIADQLRAWAESVLSAFAGNFVIIIAGMNADSDDDDETRLKQMLMVTAADNPERKLKSAESFQMLLRQVRYFIDEDVALVFEGGDGKKVNLFDVINVNPNDLEAMMSDR